MPLHILGHINADHGGLVPEHRLRQGLAKLRLANTRGTQEQEGADGTLGVFQPHPAPANGPGHGLNRLVLPHHTPVKGLFHPQQPLPLVLGHPGDGNPRPAGDHGGNVLGGDSAVPGAALPPLVPLQIHLLLVVPLNIPQLGGGLIVLPRNGGLLVLRQSGDFLLQTPQLLGGFLRLHPHPAGGLIHQIDGLVRQKAVIDIPGGEIDGSLQGLVRDLELMVLLILLPQAL